MATRREVIRFDAEPVKVKLDKGPHAGIECRRPVRNRLAILGEPWQGRDVSAR